MVPDLEQVEFERMTSEVELQRVRCYEISARAREGFERPEPATEEKTPVDLRVRTQQRPDTLGVRVRADLLTLDAEVHADMAAYFTTPENVTYSEAAVRRFVAEVALYVIFPFLRETVAEASRRVTGTPHLLGILHPGDLTFGSEFAAGVPADLS